MVMGMSIDSGGIIYRDETTTGGYDIPQCEKRERA